MARGSFSAVRGAFFLRFLFLLCAFSIFLFQGSAAAVLKAEGGKEVIVADPVKEQGATPETSKPVGFTSRVPKSTRVSASASGGEASEQQEGAASRSKVISAKTSNTSFETSSGSSEASSQPLVITATMKPTTVSPPMESFTPPVQSAAATGATGSDSSNGFMGCVLGGTLVKDITLDVCNSKGGRPLMSSSAPVSPAPADTAPKSE